MKNQLDTFIDFNRFDNYTLLEQNDSTLLITSNKKASPNKKYFFKLFNFECSSPNNQKIILNTFHQISTKNCQYLLSYKYLSLSFPSEKINQISNSPPLKYMPAFSMRYFSLETLEYVLQKPEIINNWKIENYLKCLFAVAEGMSYLHDHLICHGNLCPSNIVIDEADQFYVSDFGLLPIKKLYNKEENLFNEIYKDPNMENNEPTFKNDIYSFGILIYDLLFAFYRSNKKVNQKDLKDFIKFSEENNFKLLGSFFSQLVQLCLNQSMSKRVTFKEILNLFKTTNVKLFEISIQQLYNEFIQLNYLDNLAAHKNEYAIYKKGKMYQKSIFCIKNIENAKEYYNKIISSNNSEVQNKLGILLIENSKNDKDKLYGTKYLKLSAEQGNIHGMCNYGILLLNYDGIKKDTDKGKEYLKKSSELGYSYAQIYYCCTIVENEPSPSEIQEAIHYIKESMDQNNAFAFYIYGILIEEGKICDIDYNLAFNYFKTSLDMGYDQAKIKCDEYIKNGKVKDQSIGKEIKQYKWKSEIILNKLFQKKLNIISKNDYSSLQNNIQSENYQNTDKNFITMSKQLNSEHFINDENKNIGEKSSIKTKQSDESYSSLSSQTNDEEDLLIFKFDDFSSHTDDLIEIAKIIEKSDPTSASKIYKKALQDGNFNSIFKCIELSATFQEKLHYLQLAFEKKIPEVFSICRKYFIKRMSLKKDKEEIKEIAKVFEKYEDYSDAAYAYKKINDKINFENCYIKAIENIEKIEDEDQLYNFGIILEKKNNLMLSLDIFKKSDEKGNPNAKNKIDEINIKIRSMTQEIESSAKNELSAKATEFSTQEASLTKEISPSNSTIKDKSSSFAETLSSATDSSSKESESEVLLKNQELSESLKSAAKKSSPTSPSTKGSMVENSSSNIFQFPFFSLSNFNEDIQEERNQKEISSIAESSLIKETQSSSDSSIEEILSTKGTPQITKAESSPLSEKLSTTESFKKLESLFLPRIQTPSSLLISGPVSKISSELPHPSKGQLNKLSKPLPMPLISYGSKIQVPESTELNSLQEHPSFNDFEDSPQKSIDNNEIKNKSPTKDSMEENSISSLNEEVQEERNQKETSSISKVSIIKETQSLSSDSSIEEILSTKETPSITNAESSSSSKKLSKSLQMPLISNGSKVVVSESTELNSSQEHPSFNDFEDIPQKSIDNNEIKNISPTKDSMEENSISSLNEEVQEERNQKETSSISEVSIIKEILSLSSDSSIEEIFPTEDNQKKRKMTVRRKPIDYEIEWNSEDRDNLVKFITCFGWDRWDKSRRLTSLRQPVQKIKLAARAFLRKLISYVKDPSEFKNARTILSNSMSKEFDPSFLNEAKSEEDDNDFMNTPVMLDDEFVETMEQECLNWIRQIELLYYVNIACEKANNKKNNIDVPEVENFLIDYYWTIEDDKCLIFGTWKWGYGKYDDMKKDENITFSYKKIKGLNFPPENDLNLRLQELVEGIKKKIENENKIFVDKTLNIAKPTRKSKQKAVKWTQNDRKTILQKIKHDGVYLKDDGSLDWNRFRNECKFLDKTDDQVSNYVMKLIESKGKDNGDYKRFHSLIDLRKLFYDHSSDDLLEYISFMPNRQSGILKNWPCEMELSFYYKISQKGWGHCEEILKTQIGDAFNDDFPRFLTEDLRVINHLSHFFEFIKNNSLKDLRNNKK